MLNTFLFFYHREHRGHGDNFFDRLKNIKQRNRYAKAVLKFVKLNTVAQQREAVTRGRSLLPYRLRYSMKVLCNLNCSKKSKNLISVFSVDSVVKN
jgi:hypothetical protein